jgi:Protein of unknown function (DUF3455)
MKRRIFAVLAAAAAVTVSTLLVTGADAATPDVTTNNVQGAGVTPNAKLDAKIQVKETENKIVATLRGVGKQVYDCNDSGTGYTFREPIAELFTSRGAPAAIHGKGPFWANVDGSHVDGSGAVAAPTPSSPQNVPWLLLVGTPTPNTTGVFSNVTFIQRIDTRGGVAPAGPCTAKKTVSVDYTANYVFWASK